MQNELTARIQEACAATPAKSKERNKALAAIKWALKVAGSSVPVYACLDGLEIGLTSDKAKAQVFDGRDNEAMKLSWYQASLGETLEVELLA